MKPGDLVICTNINHNHTGTEDFTELPKRGALYTVGYLWCGGLLDSPTEIEYTEQEEPEDL